MDIKADKIVHVNIKEKWLHAPGYCDNYRLFCVVRGSLRIWTANGSVTVGENECVFLAPICRIRSCHSEESGVEFFEVRLILNNPVFETLKLYRANNSCIGLLKLLNSDISEEGKKSLICTFVEIVSDSRVIDTNEARLAQKILSFIDDNLSKQLDIDVIAEHFGYDRSHLSRVFKNVTGIAIKAYINQKRVSFSKYLLEYSEFSVNKIAVLAGFEESNLFTKFFTYHVGLTPSDYRRKLHGISTVHAQNE